MTLEERYEILMGMVDRLFLTYTGDAVQFWRTLSELKAFSSTLDVSYEYVIEVLVLEDRLWKRVGSMVNPGWAVVMARELRDSGNYTTRILWKGEQVTEFVPHRAILEQNVRDMEHLG